jgi:hypothetical protein
MPTLFRRMLDRFDRPLTTPGADPFIQLAALAVIYGAVGVALWYFWIVRPLWLSVALLLAYVGLPAYFACKSLFRVTRNRRV